MNRFVYTVFKAIALSMIFVFVWDLGFYLYRAISLNNRVENIISSMERTISENNYMPASDSKLYRAMFQSLGADFNGGDTDTNKFVRSVAVNSSTGGYPSASNAYLVGTTLTDSDMNESLKNTGVAIRGDISYPANYGDIMALDVKVEIVVPIWGFGSSGTLANEDFGSDKSQLSTTKAIEGDDYGSRNWNRQEFRHRVFGYRRYIPCMHYQRLTT